MLGFDLVVSPSRVEFVCLKANDIGAYRDRSAPFLVRPVFHLVRQFSSYPFTAIGFIDHQASEFRKCIALHEAAHISVRPTYDTVSRNGRQDKVFLIIQHRGQALRHLLRGGWVPELGGEVRERCGVRELRWPEGNFP